MDIKSQAQATHTVLANFVTISRVARTAFSGNPDFPVHVLVCLLKNAKRKRVNVEAVSCQAS